MFTELFLQGKHRSGPCLDPQWFKGQTLEHHKTALECNIFKKGKKKKAQIFNEHI